MYKFEKSWNMATGLYEDDSCIMHVKYEDVNFVFEEEIMSEVISKINYMDRLIEQYNKDSKEKLEAENDVVEILKRRLKKEGRPIEDMIKKVKDLLKRK